MDDFRNEAANAVPIWLDYTSLRQCTDDFNMPLLTQLIRSVPVFVAMRRSLSHHTMYISAERYLGLLQRAIQRMENNFLKTALRKCPFWHIIKENPM